MASRKFASFVLFLQLIVLSLVETSPLTNCVKLLNHTETGISLQNISKVLIPLHHVEQQSMNNVQSHHNFTEPNHSGLEQYQDLLRLAALVPAETLQLLRMVAVPLLNTTFAVPAHVLGGASKLSLSDFNPGNWTGNTTSWMNVSEIISLPSHGIHSFNLTSIRSSANSTVHNRILTPVASLFAYGANTTKSALPVALDADHMKRHFQNLKSYLTARQSVAADTTTEDAP